MSIRMNAMGYHQRDKEKWQPGLLALDTVCLPEALAALSINANQAKIPNRE